MAWAKHHAHAPHDLTGSNLFPLELAELPGAAEALRLWGANEDGYPPLLEAIADRYGVAVERVCTAPGTSGANFVAMAAVIRPGDEVVIERPAYDPLLAAARMLGATVRRFERNFENDFGVDPDDVAAALGPDTRLVVLTNLHNPSGVATTDETLAALGEHAARVGARVLVDEVYRETAFEAEESAAAPPTAAPGATPSAAPAAMLGDTFISTSSLTKTWGLSGLRCGWIIAAPQVAEAMRRTRDVVDAVGSFPSDALAAVAFSQIERLTDRSRSILTRNARALRKLLDASDAIEWVRPTGGPVAFPRLRGTADAGPFVDWIREKHGVGVVPGRFFEMPAHFRVAVGGDPEKVEAALDRLGDGLRQWEAER